MNSEIEVQCTRIYQETGLSNDFLLTCSGKAPVQDGQEWVSDGGGAVLWRRYMAHLVWQGPDTCWQSHHQGEWYQLKHDYSIIELHVCANK